MNTENNLEKLVNQANRVLVDWYAELTEKNRNGILACCAEGDQVKLEVGMNPAPFDRTITIAVTLTNAKTKERATISEIVVVDQASH
ncbi:MAG: hypothetical protein WC009_11605 [Methylotenera sp.]